MTYKRLPLEEYKALHKKLLDVLRPEPKLHPYMTEEERLQAIEEAVNPPLPSYIDYWETDGLVRYICDT